MNIELKELLETELDKIQQKASILEVWLDECILENEVVIDIIREKHKEMCEHIKSLLALRRHYN